MHNSAAHKSSRRHARCELKFDLCLAHLSFTSPRPILGDKFMPSVVALIRRKGSTLRQPRHSLASINELGRLCWQNKESRHGVELRWRLSEYRRWPAMQDHAWVF